MTVIDYSATVSGGVMARMSEYGSGLYRLDGTGVLHPDVPPARWGEVVGMLLDDVRIESRMVIADARALPFRDATLGAVAYGLRSPGDPTDAGAIPWGPRYRAFHRAAWLEVTRVLRPGGVLLLNWQHFIRRGAGGSVSRWHFSTLTGLGYQPMSRAALDRAEANAPGPEYAAAVKELMSLRRPTTIRHAVTPTDDNEREED